MRQGNDILKGTKYRWLSNPENEDLQRTKDQKTLRGSNLKTARAWAMKEHAMCLFNYTTSWAQKGWMQWYGWAIRIQLESVKQVARTFKTQLWGIINAIVRNADNSLAESIDSRSRLVNRRSKGFRNKRRFKMAIFFTLGKLDLHPVTPHNATRIIHSIG